MKLNRRKFLKLLGEATAVSGIAAVVGLPEVSEINEEMSEVTFDYVGPSELSEKITRWKGKTFQGRSFNTQKDDPDIPVHFEDTPDEVNWSNEYGQTIATWNGKAWSKPVNT